MDDGGRIDARLLAARADLARARQGERARLVDYLGAPSGDAASRARYYEAARALRDAEERLALARAEAHVAGRWVEKPELHRA